MHACMPAETQACAHACLNTRAHTSRTNSAATAAGEDARIFWSSSLFPPGVCPTDTIYWSLVSAALSLSSTSCARCSSSGKYSNVEGANVADTCHDGAARQQHIQRHLQRLQVTHVVLEKPPKTRAKPLGLTACARKGPNERAILRTLALKAPSPRQVVCHSSPIHTRNIFLPLLSISLGCKRNTKQVNPQ